jgi:O-succinylbenzoic acid--CoA ligase
VSAPRPWLASGRASEATAVVVGGRNVSRAELAARADALAGWLESAGASAGEPLAALLPNGLPFAELLHAADRLDAVLLPLNVRLTPREIAFQLRDAGARLLLCDGRDAGVLTARAKAAAQEATGIEVLRLPEHPPPRAAMPAARHSARPGKAEPRSEAKPSEARSLDAPLALLYTSGTTGRPKGVLLSHRNFLASAEAAARHLGTQPDDRWLACMPLFHVGGLSILLRAALAALPVVVHERFDPEAASHALDAEEITLVSLVPTMLERLLEARGKRRAPPRLRYVLLGGGPAPPALAERAAKLGFPLAPTYGLTEAASQVATLRPTGSADPTRDGLEPLPGTELRILAEHGRSAEPGERGEILVRGPTLMRGYANRPDETRRVLRDGWLHTGDLGYLDTHGRLFVLDRRRDLILSGGENVYPAEVEAALLEHPDVLDAGVAGIADAAFGRRPAAWLVLRPGRALAAQELERFCRQRLAGYKVPVRYLRVDSLPRNAAGKLLRHHLGKGKNGIGDTGRGTPGKRTV